MVQIAEQPAGFPFLQRFLSDPAHRSPQQQADLPFHPSPHPFRSKNAPCPFWTGGRKDAVPPLVRRLLADNGLIGCSHTPDAVTGAPDTALLGQNRSGGCSKAYSQAAPLPLAPFRGFSGQAPSWYSSLSSQFDIALHYSITRFVCQRLSFL